MRSSEAKRRHLIDEKSKASNNSQWHEGTVRKKGRQEESIVLNDEVDISTAAAARFGNRDLLSSIPDACLTHIFSYLPNFDLAVVIPSISRFFFKTCDDYDDVLWRHRCRDLWRSKVWVQSTPSLGFPICHDFDYEACIENAKSEQNTLKTYGTKHTHELKFRNMYDFSIKASKTSNLTKDALSSKIWAFRFKAAAGEDWMELDPYWQWFNNYSSKKNHNMHSYTTNSLTYTLRQFNMEGTISRPRPTSSSNQLQSRLQLSKLQQTQQPDRIEQELQLMGIPQPLHYKIYNSRRGIETGTILRGEGMQFVKVRNWPSVGIERTDNWGWVMQNQWVAYVFPPETLISLHEKLEGDVERWL
ncbi:hypothetical protein ACHAXS_013311 [Conticribra weissflogii]